MDNKIYKLKVGNVYIDVEQETYEEYYRFRERERYLNKLAAIHNISLEECQEIGLQVEYKVAQSQDSIEDKLIMTELLNNMMMCMNHLNTYERFIINELFFNGKSERQLSNELNIAKTKLHDQKMRIIKKLRKMIEI